MIMFMCSKMHYMKSIGLVPFAMKNVKFLIFLISFLSCGPNLTKILEDLVPFASLRLVI